MVNTQQDKTQPSRWQDWKKTQLVSRQADSNRLSLDAKFIALGVASVASTVAFNVQAGIYQIGNITTGNANLSGCNGNTHDINLNIISTIATGDVSTGTIKVYAKTSMGSGSWTRTDGMSRIWSGKDSGKVSGGPIVLFNNDLINKGPFLVIAKDTLNTPSFAWLRLDVDSVSSVIQPTYRISYGYADTAAEITPNNTNGLTDIVTFLYFYTIKINYILKNKTYCFDK
ncbi:hypothetical protein QUF74_14985 [Candidatus Halobeggiatoa sp. HSG11]|nr:hypothetical protein [Candidatus Halobeggiatoa sp. HSG11]